MPTKQNGSLLELPLSLHSPQQLEEVAHYVERVLAARRVHKPDPDDPGMSAETIAWLQRSLRGGTIAGAEELIRSLRELVAGAPQIEVITAARLDDGARNTVVGWLRRIAGAPVLVRWSVRTGVLAGVIIRTSRREYDCSLAAALEASKAQLKEAIHAWA